MTTRPPNCRIFLGNLPSERTSREELHEIFSKYGNIVEEIVLRRSFGFIQYDNPESAMAAIRGENGRIIGGMRVDINLADNREPKKRNDKDKDSRRDKRRSPSPTSSRRRTRDDYEYRESQDNELDERRKRQYGGAVPQYMSNVQPNCQVIYLGQPEKDYAYRVGQLLSQQIATLRTDYLVTERRNLPQAIDKAKQRFRYVLVIGKFHQSRQTVDLHIMRQNMQPEVLSELPYLEAVEKIRAEEQRVNMFASMTLGNNVGTNQSTGAYAYVNPAFLPQFQVGTANLQQQQLLQQLLQMQQNSNTLNQLVGGSALLPTPYSSVGSLPNLPNNQNTMTQPSVPGNLANSNLQYSTSTTNNPSDLFSTLLNNSQQILQSLNNLSSSQNSSADNKSSRNANLPNTGVAPTNNALSSLYNMMASTSNPTQLETANPALNLTRLTSPDSAAVNLNGNVGPRPSPSPSNVTIGSGGINPALLGSQNSEMLASLLSKLSGANIPGSGNMNANFNQSISSQGPSGPNYSVLGSPSPQTNENQGSEEYSPYAPSIMGNPQTNPLGSILSRKS